MIASTSGSSRVLLSLLVSCLWILPSCRSAALVDTNSNGVSDLWEKDHTGGHLFPATFDLQADPDGDGWTNLLEAAAGTNPFDANPPGGYLRPALAHYPAVYITGENGPETVTPEIYTLTWPTLIGKQYTLLFSATLAPGSWLPIGPPVTATGPDALVGIPIVQPDGSIPAAIFWKVAVSDTGDADGDGLNEYEESQLGTDPYNATSDGTPDSAKAGTYPGNSGSGNPPGGGSTPSATLEPLYMNYVNRFYLEYCTTTPPDDPGGTETATYQSMKYRHSSTINQLVLDDPVESDTNLNTSSLSIRSGLHGIGYPPFETIQAEILPHALGCAENGYGPSANFSYYEYSDGGYSSAGGGAVASRFRIERLLSETTPRSRTYLKVTRDSFNTKVIALAATKLTIPADELHSNEEDLETEVNDAACHLARFSISDNRTATGVDDISHTVENLPGSGYQDLPWIMAPCGGTITQGGITFPMTNDVKIRIGNSIPGAMEITCQDASVTPAVVPAISGLGIIHTSWKGTGGESGDRAPIFKFGTGADRLSATLSVRVKVMKKRTVSVRVHYVTGAHKDPATGLFSELKPPLTMPSQQAIIQKLSVVYGSQVNAWFTNLEVVHETTDWDTSIASAWGSQAHPIPSTNTSIPPFNKILDLGGNFEGLANAPSEDIPDLIEGMTSPEEQKLLDLRGPEIPGAIDVFIVGGCEGIRTSSGALGGITFLGGSTLGQTKRTPRVCFIAGALLVNQAPLPENRLLQTIAHEIGHVIVGKGHPDKTGNPDATGPAPLKGTDPLNRLMYSDLTDKAVRGKLGHNLLVKAEWDAAETWMKNFVDAQTP